MKSPAEALGVRQKHREPQAGQDQFISMGARLPPPASSPIEDRKPSDEAEGSQLEKQGREFYRFSYRFWLFADF